jgi:RimJ/RimL family protein N-acetyltransferase
MTPELSTLRRIQTPRLSLQPVCPADRNDLIALEADAEVMRYLNGGQSVPEAGLADASFLTPRGHEPEVLAAHLCESGDFIGWFALFEDGWVDGIRTAELGYRLARSAWGKGYATEGVRSLVVTAFRDLRFERIRAETMAVNQASRRVLEKAGFLPVETMFPCYPTPFPGAELGEVIYEIRKGDHPIYEWLTKMDVVVTAAAP